MQQRRFFHSYYGHYCFLPLYIFRDHDPLAAVLRPGNTDPAQERRAHHAPRTTRVARAVRGQRSNTSGVSIDETPAYRPDSPVILVLRNQSRRDGKNGRSCSPG